MLFMFFMADEKTEPATPKKRKEAREEGRVPKSNELTTSIIMLTLFSTLILSGDYVATSCQAAIVQFFKLSNSFDQQSTVPYVTELLRDISFQLLRALLPIMSVSVAIAILVNGLQTRLLFTVKTLKPKFSKINPLQGAKRILSMHTVVEMLKSILKTLFIGYLSYSEIIKSVDALPNLSSYTIMQNVEFFLGITMAIAYKTSLALLVLGVGDYIYQWWENEKNMKMSKQEIKDEYKQTEGDPKIKQRIRDAQRTAAMRRMMRSVETADVVLTNPTHYAVALKYDGEQHAAPIVVAKGADFLAKRIREKAEEFGVDIVENPPLARSLYNLVEIDQPINEDMYAAVAEILAEIFKKRQKQ